MNRSAYQAILDRLHRLTIPQLMDVQRRIVELLNQQPDDAESAAANQALQPREAPTRSAGHIEEKYINGCGPYRYLRVWRNGKLTSKYLGKKPLT